MNENEGNKFDQEKLIEQVCESTMRKCGFSPIHKAERDEIKKITTLYKTTLRYDNIIIIIVTFLQLISIVAVMLLVGSLWMGIEITSLLLLCSFILLLIIVIMLTMLICFNMTTYCFFYRNVPLTQNEKGFAYFLRHIIFCLKRRLKHSNNPLIVDNEKNVVTEDEDKEKVVPEDEDNEKVVPEDEDNEKMVTKDSNKNTDNVIIDEDNM